MKFFLLLVIIALLFSCTLFNFKGDSDCVPRPLTKAESKFFDELKMQFDSIRYDRYDNYECDNETLWHYSLMFENVPINLVKDKDSLQKISEQIVTRLYNEVVEDSILFITPVFEVIFYSIKTDLIYDSKGEEMGYSQYHTRFEYKKDDLSNYYGIKIKKTGKNKFERIKIKPETDSLIFKIGKNY